MRLKNTFWENKTKRTITGTISYGTGFEKIRMKIVCPVDEPPMTAEPNGTASRVYAWEACGPGRVNESAPAASTPARTAAGAARGASRPHRSPVLKTHQPYRGLPLSIVGVDSELQSYAESSSDRVVAVKPAYKSGLQRSSPPSACSAGAVSQSLRTSQRSPITALDAGDAIAAPPALSSGAVGATAAGLSMAAARPARPATNKRIVSLDTLDRHGTGTGAGAGGDGGEGRCCSVALRMVEAEEKHLNYTGVQLQSSDLNLSDTAERARRLQQRRRQMQYGKETAGYANYIAAVPNRWDREFRNPMHPMTPRPEYDCSKRTFDRYLNIWRRQLHLWDDYERSNPDVQHVRIGIPTLRRLGLEVPPCTPDPYTNGLRAFTPPTVAKNNGACGSGGIASCTPVTYRLPGRDSFVSSSYHRQQQQQQQQQPCSYATGGGNPGGSVPMPHHTRPSSGCGGASWSITNTPHTPYHGGNMSCHGSTHSNNSYPTLLSVLAQPTIYSPHWADSSQHSSPTPNNAKCSGAYYHPGGMPAGASGGGTGGGAGYWDSSSHHNSAGHVHRYTPHATPGHQYQYHHAPAVGSAGMTGDAM